MCLAVPKGLDRLRVDGQMTLYLQSVQIDRCKDVKKGRKTLHDEYHADELTMQMIPGFLCSPDEPLLIRSAQHFLVLLSMRGSLRLFNEIDLYGINH